MISFLFSFRICHTWTGHRGVPRILPGGMHILADQPPPPPDLDPDPHQDFELDPDPAPDPHQNNADQQPWALNCQKIVD